MTQKLQADILLNAQAVLGECPRWDSRRERLLWVDIEAGLIHDTDPVTVTDATYAVGEKVGALAPRDSGGAVLATASGFALFAFDTGEATPLVALEKPDDVIMNDGACDPSGRFWAGTVAMDERPGTGRLYCLEPSGEVREILSGVTVSNGIGWSADARLMYYVDSATQGVDVFDFDIARGMLANRRRLIEIAKSDGVPDGLTLDDDDAIWVALWGGGQVRRYLPNGLLERTIAVPTSHVTACAFGGHDGSTLYITSAGGYVRDDDRARDPLAGGLFVATPGVTGAAAAPFVG